MRKHRNTTTYYILVIYLSIVAALCLLGMASCNPVKQVLKSEDKKRQVWEAGVLADWCVNDTAFVSDTTVLLDTLYNIEYKSDTVTVGDSVWIDRVEYRTISKTVTIRDTAVVRDNSLIDLQRKAIEVKDKEIKALYEKGKELEQDFKDMKHRRNKWRLYFFLLLAVITAFILRKPIIKLAAIIISPIKL